MSSLTFNSTLMHMGDAIDIEISHRDFDQLLNAVEDFKQSLTEFSGVIDIDDSFVPGKLEIKLELKDRARMLGLTLADLGMQVRQGF